ncbi:hypothetical protein [Actinophytocola sp.]|uniref:hypothetical protein n=1 Tax=Actinophytocola sp. TaxID=1872138 RepID=UPI002D3F6B10|nr:hypothetical protein [Actinophytocola sp.]HYQ66844.1 hypothetical protein [Actinophytocola sp.]
MQFDTDQTAEVDTTDVDTTDIDEAIAGTENLDTVTLTEHVARFDAVHVALNEALTSIDTD